MRAVFTLLLLICLCANPVDPQRSQFCGLWYSDTSHCINDGSVFSEAYTHNLLDINNTNATITTYKRVINWMYRDNTPCTISTYIDTLSWFCPVWKLKPDTILLLDATISGTMVVNFSYQYKLSGDNLLILQHDRGCGGKTWFNYKRMF